MFVIGNYNYETGSTTGTLEHFKCESQTIVQPIVRKKLLFVVQA